MDKNVSLDGMMLTWVEMSDKDPAAEMIPGTSDKFTTHHGLSVCLWSHGQDAVSCHRKPPTTAVLLRYDTTTTSTHRPLLLLVGHIKPQLPTSSPTTATYQRLTRHLDTQPGVCQCAGDLMRHLKFELLRASDARCCCCYCYTRASH